LRRAGSGKLTKSEIYLKPVDPSQHLLKAGDEMYPGRQTDGGFTMLGLGDLLTQLQRKTPMPHIILNNGSLDFVKIEQQEVGTIPSGVEFDNPNFAEVAEAVGAKGIRIEDPGDVHGGLAEALPHKTGPAVLLNRYGTERWMTSSKQSKGT
jgi:thiamine pyrophosphate-dependent acetolactate synthase large subunit-like protein